MPRSRSTPLGSQRFNSPVEMRRRRASGATRSIRSNNFSVRSTSGSPRQNNRRVIQKFKTRVRKRFLHSSPRYPNPPLGKTSLSSRYPLSCVHTEVCLAAARFPQQDVRLRFRTCQLALRAFSAAASRARSHLFITIITERPDCSAYPAMFASPAVTPRLCIDNQHGDVRLLQVTPRHDHAQFFRDKFRLSLAAYPGCIDEAVGTLPAWVHVSVHGVARRSRHVGDDGQRSAPARRLSIVETCRHSGGQ